MPVASVMLLFCAMSRLYVPSRVTETVTRYRLPEPVRFAMLPAPVLPGDSAKSAWSTPATFSLKVTAKTRVCAEAVSVVGSLRSIDVTVGISFTLFMEMALPDEDAIGLPSVSTTS